MMLVTTTGYSWCLLSWLNTIVILSFNLSHNLGLIQAPIAKFSATRFFAKNGDYAGLTLSWHHHAVKHVKNASEQISANAVILGSFKALRIWWKKF